MKINKRLLAFAVSGALAATFSLTAPMNSAQADDDEYTVDYNLSSEYAKAGGSGVIVVTIISVTDKAGDPVEYRFEYPSLECQGDAVVGWTCSSDPAGTFPVFVVLDTDTGPLVVETILLTFVDPMPEIEMKFDPDSIWVGEESTLTFTITNDEYLLEVTYYFSVELPGWDGGDLSYDLYSDECGVADLDDEPMLHVYGTFDDGDESCTVVLTVTGRTAGTYELNPEDFEDSTAPILAGTSLEVRNPPCSGSDCLPDTEVTTGGLLVDGGLPIGVIAGLLLAAGGGALVLRRQLLA